MKNSIFTGTAVLLCAFGFSARIATALEIGPDAFGYTAADAPFVFEDLSGSGARVLGHTDNEVASAPLGFTFTYYGVDYTSVSWSTNALITFGGTNADSENLSFAAAAPTGDRPSAAVLWDDWQFVQPGSDAAYYETRGEEGSRRFLVQWNLMFGSPSSPSNVVFEAVFFEGTNDILFAFLDVDTASEQSFGASSTVGIRDSGAPLNGRSLEWSFNSSVIMTRQAIRFHAPSDTTPPSIEITSPADGAVIGSEEVSISAVVSDESPSSVSSDPPGISTSLPAGGGPVRGNVALVEGLNTIVLSATDAASNVGGKSVTVVRDMTVPTLNVIFPVDGSILGDTPVTLFMEVGDATATTVSVGSTGVLVPAGGGMASIVVALAEGLNTVGITAVDAAGNSSSGMVSLVLDLSPPLVTIDSPADGVFFGPRQSPVSVVATVNDASPTRVESTPAGVSASFPAGGGIAVGAVPLVEGPNVITVAASDATGRTGTASLVVHLDTTAPEVTLDSPSAGMALRGVVEVAASALDQAPGSGVAHVEFLVDTGVVASFAMEPFAMTLDTSLFSDGSHTLTATAVDGAGNAASSQAGILVDNQSPTVVFTSPADGAFVRGTFSFSVAAQDAYSGLALIQLLACGRAPSVDPSSSFDPTISSVALNGEVDTTRWPDGMLALTALAVDAAGNETLTGVEVLVDNAPPGPITITPKERSVVSGVVTITAEDADLDGGTLELYVDEVLQATASYSPLAVEFDTTSRADGIMVIRAVARDMAGNEASSTSTVTVDNIAVAMRLTPTVLNLKLRRYGDDGGKDHDRGVVIAHLEGSGLLSLIPYHVELRIPGGSPVRALGAWQDCRPDAPKRLNVKFDRLSVVSSIQAGIASGEIDPSEDVEVSLFADGVPLATAHIRVVHG